VSTSLNVAKSIVNGLPDAAILLDHLQHMVAYNAAFATLVGLRGAGHDGVGIAIEPFNLLGTDPEGDQQRAKECFDKRTVIRLAEVTAKTETGAAYTMQVTFLPVLELPDRSAFVIVVFRDVTDEASLQVRYRALLTAEQKVSDDLRSEIASLKDRLG
jgi:PAS domain S-box-containing protein